MKRRTALLGALLALSGCDYVQVSLGGNEANEAAANRSIAAPPPLPRNDARPADAGVTTSRSLQPRAPDNADPLGSKDPDAGAGGPPGAAVDPAYLVGRWGDEGSCASMIEFFPNGTFRAANGGRGNWRIEGDRLIFSGAGRAITLRLRIISQDVVIGTDANGAGGRSQRC
jgi:hypothetical protein